MKKKLLSLGIILALFLTMITLTGCGDDDKEDKKDKKKDENETSSIEEGEEIYESSRDEIGTATASMAKQEKAMFNSTFEKYEGTQKGTSVKQLIEDLITNNLQYEGEEGKEVSIEVDGEEYTDISDIRTLKNKIAAGKTYEVSLEYKKDVVVKVVIE